MKSQHQLALLEALKRHFTEEVPVTSASLASELEWDHDYAVGMLKSLEMMSKIKCDSVVETEYELTAEGETIAQTGSPEYILSSLLPLSIQEIKSNASHQRALAYCLKNKWVKKEGDLILLISAPSEDKTRRQALELKKKIYDGGEDLTKRKLARKITRTIFLPQPTSSFDTSLKKELIDLDRAMILSGDWKGAEFKEYNWNAGGIVPSHGSTHPLMKTRSIFRQVLQQMGFEEMDTRRWVENSFWNFDSLFQPQTHPVRDAHDTFFLSSPSSSQPPEVQPEKQPGAHLEAQPAAGSPNLLDRDYLLKVKKMHQSGDDESLGWQCPWDENESYKLILRTHTTAVTSRLLRNLSLNLHRKEKMGEEKMGGEKMGEEKSGGGGGIARGGWKYFSIDRVFRNETLDATHLAEFHQVEGIMISDESSLAVLMGIIKTFFDKIGIHDIKFKPAYNPYTEPSMEIFGYHPTLNQWTEIGNSGVFRPEMLKPMGLPSHLNVLGWGLSLERPTMINYNLKDIRQLFGPKAKLNVF